MMQTFQASRMQRYRSILLHLLQMSTDLPPHVLEYLPAIRTPRIQWAFSRPQYAFDENFNNNIQNPYYWKQNFRMSKETLLDIVEICRPFMAPGSNFVRQPVPIEKRTAIALSWLMTGNSYITVGETYGVHKSTVIKFTKMFLKGMIRSRNSYIKFPKTQSDIKKCIDSFSGKTELPNVVGAIDGTHVAITKPESESAVDYFSRKQVHTIVNQAVCDGNLIFISVDAGYPGSIHDSRMLEHSWIFDAAEERGVLDFPITDINIGNTTTKISPYLLGDPAYPCLKWLMKPYEYGTNDSARKKFNYQLSRARSCIERAFGLLKGRFRILMKKMEFSPKQASTIFVVCCILHNILQRNGEEEDDDFIDDLVSGTESRSEVGTDKDGEKKRKTLSLFLQNL